MGNYYSALPPVESPKCNEHMEGSVVFIDKPNEITLAPVPKKNKEKEAHVIPALEPQEIIPALEPPVIPALEPPVIPALEPPVIPALEPPVIPALEPPVIPALEPPVIPALEPPVIPALEPPVIPALEPPAILSSAVSEGNYVYNDIMYIYAFPQEWARNHILDTGPESCPTCISFGMINDIFVGYCSNCAKLYHDYERGLGFIDNEYSEAFVDVDYLVNSVFLTYLKDVEVPYDYSDMPDLIEL